MGWQRIRTRAPGPGHPRQGRGFPLRAEGLERRGLLAALAATYPLPPLHGAPSEIAAGPDGALWFVEDGGQSLGRIATSGQFATFGLPIPSDRPGVGGIVAGPDGALWFTETGANAVGRITPDDRLAVFPLPTADARPSGIALGPDGALWFAETGANAVGRITPTGDVTEFPLPTADLPAGIPSHWPRALAAGPDGSLWFTEGGGEVGRITPAGAVAQFSIPGGNDPTFGGIAAGPDGNLWFTENGGLSVAAVGRITPTGDVTEFPVPTPYNDDLGGITAGPDGNLWFTGMETDTLVRLTPAGAFTDYAVAHTTPPFHPPARPFGVATGPDGDLWITLENAGAVGKFDLNAPGDPLAATGTVITPMEGENFTAVVARFLSNDPKSVAGDFTATIDFYHNLVVNEVVPPVSGTVSSDGQGGFIVTGSGRYPGKGAFFGENPIFRVTITDNRRPGVSATAYGKAILGDQPIEALGVYPNANPNGGQDYGFKPLAPGVPFRGVVAEFLDGPGAPGSWQGDPGDGFTVTIDWGDGTAPTLASLGPVFNTLQDFGVSENDVFPGRFFSVIGKHTYAAAGRFTIQTTIRDSGGTTAIAATTTDVLFPAPTVTASAVSATEGTPFSGTVATFTDPDPQTRAGDYTAEIAWIPGEPFLTSPGVVTSDGHGGFVVSGTHTFRDFAGSGFYNVSVSRTHGEVGQAGGALQVADAPLSIAGLAATTSEGLPRVDLAVIVLDPGGASNSNSYAATTDWGDGTTSFGTVAVTGPPGAAPATLQVIDAHDYGRPGSFPIRLTIRETNGSASATIFGAVFVPGSPGSGASPAAFPILRATTFAASPVAPAIRAAVPSLATATSASTPRIGASADAPAPVAVPAPASATPPIAPAPIPPGVPAAILPQGGAFPARTPRHRPTAPETRRRPVGRKAGPRA